MKKTIALLLAAGIITTAFTGCKASVGKETPIETTSAVTTAKVTTAATTSAPAETTTTQSESEKIDIDVGSSSGGALSSKKGFFSLFPNADMSAGYIADDGSEIDSAILASDTLTVKALTEETFLADVAAGENENTLYKFAMYNSSPAEEIGEGSDALYASSLTLSDVSYFVTFGFADAASYDEVIPYCSEGTTWEYWAFGSVSEQGNYILMPLIAGSADTGYWAVRPVLSTIGFDVSDMMSLSGESNVTDSTDSPAANNGEEGVYLDVISVENSDGYVTAEYLFTNNYPVGLWLDNVTATLNGEDVTEDVIIYLAADANSVQENSFSIYDHEIYEGDTLIISGMLVNTETYEDAGEISLPLTFSAY